jgi:hypothetical protein
MTVESGVSGIQISATINQANIARKAAILTLTQRANFCSGVIIV